eukprot:2980245-Prymnesium_polylepis.1
MSVGWCSWSTCNASAAVAQLCGTQRGLADLLEPLPHFRGRGPLTAIYGLDGYAARARPVPRCAFQAVPVVRVQHRWQRCGRV